MGSQAANLGALLEAGTSCSTYEQLRGVLMDGVGGVLGARAWAVYLLDGTLRPCDVAFTGVPDAFLDRYEEIGRCVDPVMRDVIDSHAPAHDLLGRTAPAWHAEPLYQHVASRFGFEHILTVPILGGDQIIGTINCGRRADDRPFDDGDVRRSAALGAHVSVWCAHLRARAPVPELSRREVMIARYVAAGLTNGEIAICLSISRDTVKATLKRLFAKLDVQARAELVARLAAAGILY